MTVLIGDEIMKQSLAWWRTGFLVFSPIGSLHHRGAFLLTVLEDRYLIVSDVRLVNDGE